jgi:predicted transcriptional regulator
MDTLYWLIFFSGAIAVGVYARHWYNRPSEMPEMLGVSYSYQTLKFIEFHVNLQKKSSEKNLVSMTETIEPYLKKRNLNWRQRNDIIKYMLRADWVYEIPQDGNKYYTIAEAGERELETADGLRRAAEQAALTLHDCGIGSDQAKVEAAATIAAAFRVDASVGSPENSQRAQGAAEAIEEAVKTGDPDKVQRVIDRTKDLLQIATYALPFVRDILRILGLP